LILCNSLKKSYEECILKNLSFFVVKTWQPCTKKIKRLLLWARQICLEHFCRLLIFPLEFTEVSLLFSLHQFNRYSKFRFQTKAMNFSTDIRANWALGAFYKTPATKVDFSIVLKINYNFQTFVFSTNFHRYTASV